MPFLLIPLLLLAGSGFALSLSLHLPTLLGYPPLVTQWLGEKHTELLPGAITAGIFVVWLPATVIANRIGGGRGTRFSWKPVLAGCPPWMLYAVYGLVGYAVLNFFIALSDGPRVNNPHGDPLPFARVAGGHWLLFYGAAFAIFWSALQRAGLLRSRQCPTGHTVSHADRFCPLCGLAVPGSEHDLREPR
ncbi:MAG: hypothetical protein ACN6O3_04130 [Comamonas sp.]